ncbi:MAG: TIGR03560 family F420-dependent LLM class oxidoreductase [Dehalococcoidia bacterium]
MKLGVMIEGQEGLTWDRWRTIMRRTEELGYESLWRSDHFWSLMGHPERNALETFTSLTLAAAETTRLRFGPLVAPLTFRHPALMARMAAAIDQLSGGRFVLGVGAGWNVPEHAAFGLPFPPVRDRMDMLEEGIQVIRALLRPGKATFEGRHYRLTEAEMHPKPAQAPLPLLVGGGGERRTLRIVARYADEWNLTGATPDRVREKSAVLERHCAAEGRDPRAIARSLMVGFVIGRNDRELSRRLAALRVVMPNLGAGSDADTLDAPVAGAGWPAVRPR